MRSHLEWLRYRRNCTQAVRCSPHRRSIHRTGLGTTRGDRSCMQIHSCNRCTTSIHRSRHLPWQKHHNCKQMDWCTLLERNALATEIFNVVKSIAHARQGSNPVFLDVSRRFIGGSENNSEIIPPNSGFSHQKTSQNAQITSRKVKKHK